MTIDPRWSFFLSLFLGVLGFVGGAGSQFTDLGLSPDQVKHLLAACALLMGLGNVVNAALAAIPSPSDPESLKKFYLGPKPATPATPANPPETKP